MPEEIQLERKWTKGDEIGVGGFGRVFEAEGERGELAALKFVEKAPGADREVLVAKEAAGCPHVLPVLDSGEYDGHWVLAMPRAEHSLADALDSAPNGLPLDDALKVLRDVVAGLEGIQGKIIHRDLKPSNILFWNGAWYISDFGIARYSDATTATISWKDVRTAAYAAPEQWNQESPTPKLDIYAFGVIAYEILTGRRLFPGPSIEDYREQHLTQDSFDVEGISYRLQVLLRRCVKKIAAARPAATEVAHFLSAPVEPQSDIAHRLSRHDAAESQRQLTETARIEAERQRELKRSTWYHVAQEQMTEISSLLESRARDLLSTSEIETLTGVSVKMNNYAITLSPVQDTRQIDWRPYEMPFDVIAAASIELREIDEVVHRIPRRGFRYVGRAHSLWFCDATAKGDYQWYELAFQRVGIFVRDGPWVIPMAVAPSSDIAPAFHDSHRGGFVLARPLQRLGFDRYEDFISDWLGWLADALDGKLREPNLPEGNVMGSFRTP